MIDEFAVKSVAAVYGLAWVATRGSEWRTTSPPVRSAGE